MKEERALGLSSRSSAERTSGDELETALVSPAVPLDRGDPAPREVGTSLGRYIVLEEVGRGGMGRVLRAYDPKLQREVALKEVGGRMLGSEGTGRLVAEARAMAKLSHPNVVAVYDVEELPPDQVVLVMQYVAGQTLRAWLREGDRPWSDVVAHFIEAGRGLAAAHAAGLLHRDFKPANVLVQPDAAVKVTDFGLAKHASEDSSSLSDGGQHEPSLQRSEGSTEAGMVMGTPRYMAPEQHRPGRSRSGTDSPLTAAADQYAFCVALWEALCGAPPFSGEGLEAQKRAGPSAWPKAGIPRPVADAVRRGLSAEPSHRWPSMQALLEVLAFDPAQRRRRWLAALGGAGVIVLGTVAWQSSGAAGAQRCTGAQAQLAGVWDEGRRAEVEEAVLDGGESYAAEVWERTAADLDRYAKDWTTMHTDACEATTVRGEQSTAVMDLKMACLHRAKVDFEAVTAELADADATVVLNAHRLTAGLGSLSRCADIDALQAAVEPPLPDEAEVVERIRALLAQAAAARKSGRYSQARAKAEAAKEALTEIAYGPVHTEVWLAYGHVLDAVGEYEPAEAALREALKLAARWRQFREMHSAALSLLTTVGATLHRTEEGLRYLELAQGLADGDPLREARTLNNWAVVLEARGDFEAAEAEHRKALAIRERALGPDHREIAQSLNNLASVMDSQGKFEESKQAYGRVREILEASLGSEHPDIAAPRNNLGQVFFAQGDYEASEAEFRAALALREKGLGPEHPETAAARSNLAVVFQAQGKYAESVAEFRGALAIREASLGPEHPGVLGAIANIALVLDMQGKHEEAEIEHRAALTLREKTLESDHPDVADSRSNLAGHLLDRGRPHEALELAELAWDRRKRDDMPPKRQATTAFFLARALWATDDSEATRTRARTLAQRALEALESLGPAYAENTAEIRAWLEARHNP